MITADRTLIPLGFAEATVDGTPRSLPEIPKDASFAYIQPQGGAMRWSDFVEPDGDTGHIIINGSDFWYIGNLHRFSFVKKTLESDHILTISYYKAM